MPKRTEMALPVPTKSLLKTPFFAYNLPPGHKGQGCIINLGIFSEYNRPQKFCLLVSSPVLSSVHREVSAVSVIVSMNIAIAN